MEQKYCIYCHTNKINNKKYIGQTCQKLEKRWNNGKGYINCPRFYSAIVHYGWDSFSHEILEDNLTAKEADKKEEYYIQLFHSDNPEKGYNMTKGGNSLATYYEDEQHRKEQSIRRKEYFLNNPDKKEANDIRLKKLSLKTASQRSEKMKENYANKGGLYNINESRKKCVQCVETGEVFKSLCEAAKAYNLSVGNLSMVINGKRRTTGGYHWIVLESMS